jgi:hypothetical protein
MGITNAEVATRFDVEGKPVSRGEEREQKRYAGEFQLAWA